MNVFSFMATSHTPGKTPVKNGRRTSKFFIPNVENLQKTASFEEQYVVDTYLGEVIYQSINLI